MSFQLREHKRSQRCRPVCSSCVNREVFRTCFDSWELHGETDAFIYFSHSGSRRPRSRKSPRVRLCERDDRQATGAQFISSNERPGKLVLTCGQSGRFVIIIIIIISTLYYFHTQMFFYLFLPLDVMSAQKEKHTDYSHLMVCRGKI